MESLYLLIPISVILVFIIGVVFWWSVKGGQFDDLEGPGYRVLMDDDRPRQTPVVAEEKTVLNKEDEPSSNSKDISSKS